MPHQGPFYFAWVDQGDDTFDVHRHARDDEDIFSIIIDETENDFASLKIEIRNQNIGLLAPLRKVWCWLSWFNGSSIIALFHGRLIALPSDTNKEVMTLEFIARPTDYVNQQLVISEALKVPPYHDPIFTDAAALPDPSTVLEAYSALWHIDRISLDVSISDELTGESGILDIEEDEHLHDDVSLSYGDSPLTKVNVEATVTWTQRANGNIDLTYPLVRKFQDQDSWWSGKLITSLTADGLLADWPVPGKDLGGGWSVGPATSARKADWVLPDIYGKTVKYVDMPLVTDAGVNPFRTIGSVTLNPLMNNSLAQIMFAGYAQYQVTYPLGILDVRYSLHYEASRERSEILRFTVEADIQAIFSDPAGADVETITVQSDKIGDAIDPNDSGESSIPIGDVARSSYFKTDRGTQTFEYLINLARAKILSRARTATIKFTTLWDIGIGITLKHSIQIFNRYLPGGVAVGKVIGLSLHASSDGQFVEVTIGCSVGRGGTVAPDAGDNTYAEDGYMEQGYQQVINANLSLDSNTITYETLDDFELDDDGINLLNVSINDVVSNFTVDFGARRQSEALDQMLSGPVAAPNPNETLKASATKINLTLKALTGASYQTVFTPAISLLKVPKTIDLEAA